MKFDSQFFKTADELDEARADAVSVHNDRRERLSIVRKFSNGLATMSEEEAKRLGRKEITNHLTTYSKLLQQETMFHSMVTGTNALLEIIVDTNDPERDFITGQKMSSIINRGAIHRRGRFSAFWKKAAGEIVMAGGAPAIHRSSFGWLPEVSLNFFFPKGTDTSAEKIPYCFEPVELSYADLKNLLASVKGEKGNLIDSENIRNLINHLRKQIKDRTKSSSTFGEDEVTQGARDAGGQKIGTIEAYYYYEVKYREDGSSFVSRTLFVGAMQTSSSGDAPAVRNKRNGEDTSAARFIAYQEEAYPDVHTWLHMVCIDAEIGGNKDMDSLRGMAELLYPSGSEMEELLNLILEGDKAKAKVKFRATDSAKKEDVLKWNIEQDSMVPDGIEEFEIKNGNQQLQTPFSMLDRNTSSITGSPVSNSGRNGELRVQQQERSEASSSIQINRLADAYAHLESILETVVWRLLDGPVKPGTDGYPETMWVRKRLSEENIDFKTLATREFGQFRFIRIRAKKVIGNGDRQQQIETSDWMVSQLPNIEPASRPIILQQAFALRTGDPDLAEMAIRPPKVLLNAQRVTAENEVDTIGRRALIGVLVSPQPDDIHHNHIESHLVDLQALIGADDLLPWTIREATVFAALVQHTGLHIQILIGNKATNFEGNKYLEPFQKIINSARPLVKKVQETQNQQVAQLTPKEQADIEIEVAKLELKARQLGVDEADLQDLQQIRAARSALTSRAQYVREMNERERLNLEKAKLSLVAKKVDTQGEPGKP